MPARGAAAQAEKARRKAEKRVERGRETEVQVEDRLVNEAVTELVDPFRDSVAGTIRSAVGVCLRRIKAERDFLREAAAAAVKIADDRRSELDGQVQRARTAEAELDRRKKQLEQVRREAGVKHDSAVQDHRAALTRQEEIIEEQASTIKAQAVALRAANKKA